MYKGKMVDKLFSQRGYSLYSYNFVLMMSKIIQWSLIKNVKDEQKALMFIDEFINNYAEGKKHFEIIKSNNDYDDEIMKNYFAFALQEYSNYANLGWELQNEHKLFTYPREIFKWNCT